MTEPHRDVPVSAEQLRQLFAEHKIWERMRHGEFHERVVYDKPARADVRPKGMRSQIVSYYDPGTGREVARVHQYINRRGELGGSGRPDPKQVLIDGVLYWLPV
jgi:hypothetical protein